MTPMKFITSNLTANFLAICTSTLCPYYVQSFTNSVQLFKRSCADIQPPPHFLKQKECKMISIDYTMRHCLAQISHIA